ncbi:hypothetical protein [Streptomyces sp. WAC06614]|uniref:hypothetical protein n=1 Tax=Streptomyces sp. WAC06614 TaxID=2487416 RepID=UPI0021B02978|nr:hypothetical protein [Streptomyces sp. WAC06614]
MRFAVAAQTVTLFLQAVSAGLLLSSAHGELLHGIGARVMYAAAMLHVLAAVLRWRPGGGSPRPALYATGFLALASLQVVLGIARVPSVHVPLGVLMCTLSSLHLARLLTTRHPLTAAPADAPGSGATPHRPISN